MGRLGAICITVGILLAGCQRGTEATAVAPALPPAARGAPEIAWFGGDLDAAFASAAAQHKPVFLYWGAEWCPPCHDLAAHVFSRRDFQEKLRQFVPVYLDGDAPGAQRAGNEFQVLGYPTAVVLRADRTEIVRIAGGMDLGRYADVLDLALDDVRPLPEILAGLRGNAALALAPGDCARLAYNGWLLDQRATSEPEVLVAALLLAAQRCPGTAAVERDRLTVTAAGLAAASERADITGGKPASSQLRAVLAAVATMLGDRDRSIAVADALLDLGEDFFVAARRVAPERRPQLQRDWFALMDALEREPRYSDTIRLSSAAGRLVAAKALDEQQSIPAAVAAQARATLAAFLARDYGTDARAGIVNSASWVLLYLEDDVQLRTLLEGEIRTSRSPFYYMADLADLEERAGRKEQALSLLERAYRESRGPATRFQWGALYVEGLLRMSPQAQVRIQTAVLALISELEGPDRIHARARERLERVNKALVAWAQAGNQGATLAAITQRWRQICVTVPASDPVSRACPGLLGAEGV